MVDVFNVQCLYFVLGPFSDSELVEGLLSLVPSTSFMVSLRYLRESIEMEVQEGCKHISSCVLRRRRKT